jgi:hypothetical protein
MMNITLSTENTRQWATLASGTMGYLLSVQRYLTMNHFYITQPSDSSMSFFPDNTVDEFTIKLLERIILDGDYEVALTEFIYPHSFSNIRNEDRSLYMEVRRSHDGSLETRYLLDNDYYENTSEFL